MQNYKLVRVLSRKSSKDSSKSYYLAYVVLNTDYDCSLINILINKDQFDKLVKLINDNSFDINKYIGIEYNSYQKQYQARINI